MTATEKTIRYELTEQELLRGELSLEVVKESEAGWWLRDPDDFDPYSFSAVGKNDIRITKLTYVYRKRRCEYELCVERYFGIPEGWKETDVVRTDIGHLVNLLAMFDDEKQKQNEMDKKETC